MDYNKIPANVKNVKSFKNAIAEFERTPVYGQQQNGMVKVRLNGKIGQIPQGKLKEFQKEYPGSEIINE